MNSTEAVTWCNTVFNKNIDPLNRQGVQEYYEFLMSILEGLRSRLLNTCVILDPVKCDTCKKDALFLVKKDNFLYLCEDCLKKESPFELFFDVKFKESKTI